jgi:toxin ParE1/3/4
VKPAALRPLAGEDLVERARYYEGSGGRELARRFFAASTDALRSVESTPGIGSPVIGELIEVPGLRRVGIAGSRCGWFYLEREDHLDVVRLLADRQDLETLLGGAG